MQHLHQTLLPLDLCKVESPKYIKDRVTGRRREHDVLITTTVGDITTNISIECKDWHKPVSSDTVEAFNTKCDDTRINKRIIVARRGFTADALKKASYYNIDCLSLEEFSKFQWLSSDYATVFWPDIISCTLEIDPDGENISPYIGGQYQTFICTNGVALGGDAIINLLRQLVLRNYRHDMPSEFIYDAKFDFIGKFELMEANELFFVPIRKLSSSVRYRMQSKNIPLQHFALGGGNIKYEAALGDFSANAWAGRIMIAKSHSTSDFRVTVKLDHISDNEVNHDRVILFSKD